MGFAQSSIEREARPVVEVRQPIPSLRHNQQVMYVIHRFPVKNGISLQQMRNRIVWSVLQSVMADRSTA